MYGARAGARGGYRAGRRNGPSLASRTVGGGKRWSKSRGAWVERKKRGTGINNTSMFQPSASTEYKYLDISTTAYAVNTTGAVTLINGCSQGAGEEQRVGDTMTMTSISVRGVLEANAATQVEGEALVLLLYDRHNNAGTPAIAEILNASEPFAFNSRVNTSRFLTIRRWCMPYCVTPAIGGTNASLWPKGDNGSLYVDETVKVNLPVRFEGTASTAAGIKNGAVYLVTLGDVAAGTGAVSFVAATRIRFTDT